MKKYPAWQAVFRSFFSPEMYRDVALRWQGAAYLYLLLLLAVSSLIISFFTQIAVNSFVESYAMPLIKQMPKLTFNDGKCSIDRESPYAIKTDGRPVIVFDTTGKTQTLKNSGILVTDKQLMIIDYTGNPAKVMDLKGLDGMTIDSGSLTFGAQLIKNWFGVAQFAFIWPLIFCFSVLQTLIYALAGLLFSHFLKVKLTYVQLIRLAAVALTPVIVLNTILQTLSMGKHDKVMLYWPLASVMIAMIFLVLAIMSNRPERVETSAEII